MFFATVMGRVLAGMSRPRLDRIEHGPTLNRDIIFKAIARGSNISAACSFIGGNPNPDRHFRRRRHGLPLIQGLSTEAANTARMTDS